jgi:SsrA-binding protein
MEPVKTITVNRKAYHDYIITETIEAGIVLMGTEIKSIRDGRVNLRDAYARTDKGELWLIGAHIAHYPGGNRYNHEPGRPRKLLLHRKEIATIIAKSEQKGLTLVPLKLYIKKGLAKVELGVARGKKVYDKRESLRQKETDREMDRAVKARTRR